MTPLFAHQGGWDEFLLFVGPVVLAFFVIRGLERRGRDHGEDPPEDDANRETPQRQDWG